MLHQLPEQSIDLIFADPPYNLQLQQTLHRPDMSRVDAVTDDWDQFASPAVYEAFTHDWLQACRRVLRDTGTLWVIGSYHNIYRIGSILVKLGYWILNDVIWIKTNPMPNFRGVRFTNAHETLIWAQKRQGARYTFNYQAMKALNGNLQMRSDWVLPICSGKERIRIDGKKAHSTQKPEALLYRVIQSSSNPGDVVLDPFFGTGTTGVVARKLHRHWIGIEQDADYVRVAGARIATVTPEDFDERVFDFPSKRRLPRIPFGRLLEHGLLQPGQTLRFVGKQSVSATILANGQLHCQQHQGSIHQVARTLNGGPCNGWQCWLYLDTATGQWQVIDLLREKVRAEQGQTGQVGQNAV